MKARLNDTSQCRGVRALISRRLTMVNLEDFKVELQSSAEYGAGRTILFRR